MKDERKKLGTLGEKTARDYLKKQGYKILESNFRCPFGEIDLIAKQKDCLVFVEVRTRRNLELGTPEESVTLAKRQKLIKLAQFYLQKSPHPPSHWRIDVVAIEMGPNEKVNRIELIKNAVY